MLRSLTITLITTALTLVLAADSPAGGDCFRGRPLPECRSFWITEAGTLYRFDLPQTNDKWHATLMYNWEVGLMVNQSERYAIGGSLFFNFDDLTNHTLVGFRARYRRWLSPRISLDIAPGIILSESKTDNVAFSGEVMLGADDLIAAVVRLDMRENRFKYSDNFAWYGGLRLRSYPGLVAGIAGPIIAAAIWAKHFNSGKEMHW